MAKNKLKNNFEGQEKERVVLVKLMTDKNEGAALASLEDLWRLVETAGGEVAARMIQQKDHPDPATYIGSGKVKELAELCKTAEITLAVFDCELSPSQIKNIEDGLDGTHGIDRRMLILDIFALHATSGEGKVQVEIAQLKYTAPRLTGKGIALSRQGGTSGAIGARGPGETKLETDKRHIRRRIEALERELASLEGERNVKRSKRIKQNIPTLAVVGYTNAGKSTLLNCLTDAGILAKDMLFATLDPTTRKLELPSGQEILLTDTVGFISNLPHKLVESFKSTLEEAKYADALLIVIDATDEDYLLKKEVTEQTLKELDAFGKECIYVYNKCDKLETLPVFPSTDKRNVCISAKEKTGIDALLSEIENMLSESLTHVKFLFPFDMSAAVNNLYKNANILNTEYTENGTLVEAMVEKKYLGLYKEYIC